VYEVYLERAAERDLKRVPGSDFMRIIPCVKALSEDPRPPGSHKITGAKRDWRIRVGDYRVVYEIDG